MQTSVQTHKLQVIKPLAPVILLYLLSFSPPDTSLSEITQLAGDLKLEATSNQP